MVTTEEHKETGTTMELTRQLWITSTKYRMNPAPKIWPENQSASP